jgi:hypothetical protein
MSSEDMDAFSGMPSPHWDDSLSGQQVFPVGWSPTAYERAGFDCWHGEATILRRVSHRSTAVNIAVGATTSR